MPAGSRHAVRAAAAVLLVVLAAPTAALADGGGTCKASACKVYHEQGVPNSGGQKPPTQKPPTGSNNNGGGRQPQAPKSYSRVLQHLGKDRGAVKNLLGGDAAIGSLPSGPGGGSPSLFGAAFDLGAGPTILLAILLGVGIGLAARGRVGGWLAKRSSS
jgi:hypothetical protein